MQAWKSFTILDCINFITSSIKELKPSTLNACWKNLWPEAVQSDNLIDPAENRMDAIVELGKSLGGEGFDDMNVEDIQELLTEEQIDVATLLEMASEINQTNSEDDTTDENNKVQDFTLKSIKKGLDFAEQLELYFLNEDPSTERSIKFKRELHKCLAPYNEIYKDLSAKSKQPKITDFLKKIETETKDVVEQREEDEDISPKRKRIRVIIRADEEDNI